MNKPYPPHILAAMDAVGATIRDTFDEFGLSLASARDWNIAWMTAFLISELDDLERDLPTFRATLDEMRPR